MKRFITKKFENFVNENISLFLSENGFEILNLYDAENINNFSSSLKLNSVLPKHLYEDVQYVFDNPGGIIIFSTDLNATLGKAETFKDKVKYFFTSKWKTFLNRLKANKRLNDLLLNKFELGGFTVGNSFKGSYKAKNGLQFNENSYTVEIAGVDSETLKLIASELCREFKQETVLVRDFNETPMKVYLVNDKLARKNNT